MSGRTALGSKRGQGLPRVSQDSEARSPLTSLAMRQMERGMLARMARICRSMREYDSWQSSYAWASW